MNLKRTTMVGVFTAVLGLSACGLGGGGEQDTVEPQNPEIDSSISSEIASVPDEDLQGTTITMARFFGDCDDTTQGVTDIAEATTECEAIQILTNKFAEENDWGIQIERLGGATWHSYYDGLNAALGSSDRPDVAVMHGSNLPEYASRGMLLELTDDFSINLDDATEAARDAVTFDGSDFAVPFDIHATISHLNMDLLHEAGLTDADGTYQIPTTVDDFLSDAEQLKQATGKNFIDIALSNDPMGSRLWMALVWQQGQDFIDAGARTANADSPEAHAALEFINDLVENGYTTATHDYDASQQAFLRGESAIMYNGVWAVDQYSNEAPFDYQTSDAPMLFDTPSTWANSHVWAIPTQQDGDIVKYRAAVEFVKFLYEHTGEWAVATGHMASAQSALESDAYQNAPHRDQYIGTAIDFAQMQPRLVEWPAIGDAVQQHIESTWLNDVSVDQALTELQAAIESQLS